MAPRLTHTQPSAIAQNRCPWRQSMRACHQLQLRHAAMQVHHGHRVCIIEGRGRFSSWDGMGLLLEARRLHHIRSTREVQGRSNDQYVRLSAQHGGRTLKRWSTRCQLVELRRWNGALGQVHAYCLIDSFIHGHIIMRRLKR